MELSHSLGVSRQKARQVEGGDPARQESAMDICGALVVRLLSKAGIAISAGAVLANGAAFAQGAITNGANHE